MRHIVVGGSGFTGRVLVAKLVAHGQETIIADRVPPAQPALARYVPVDLTHAASLAALALAPDDIVYHFAARQFHSGVPTRRQDRWFREVNVEGTRNLMRHLDASGVRRVVYLSTDMVYGIPARGLVRAGDPRAPIGPYGQSKREAEDLLFGYRERGFRITVLRPRMIVGPGRYGILTKLFALMRHGLPVPMIGGGANCYQMVSVFDVVSAVQMAAARGCPDIEANLGSANPPTVRALLRGLIARAGSRSAVVPTPGSAVKAAMAGLEFVGFPLMYREQYRIADVHFVVDIEQTHERLGWRPGFTDEDMLFEAYAEYTRRAGARAD